MLSRTRNSAKIAKSERPNTTKVNQTSSNTVYQTALRNNQVYYLHCLKFKRLLSLKETI